MGKSLSRPQSSQNPAEQRRFDETRQFVAEHGMDGIGGFYRKQVESWKDVTLNFLVTGASGSGKSTFINAIRGLNDFDEGAAAVGVTETTQECTPYSHPFNPRIIFWDVPGIGTRRRQNIEKYCKEVNLKMYDAFLFVCYKRFTAYDLQLVEEAISINKPFFFIRAQIGSDVNNVRLSRTLSGLEFNEEQMLAEVNTMRENCYTNLQELLTSENDIFLIDSYSPEEWDFNRLIAAIADVLPERTSECFILSLSNVTRECLKRKAKLLRVRAGLLAAATAPASAIPVPGVGAVVDLALIVGEVVQYRKLFGLPANDSEEFKKLDEALKKRLLRYTIATAMKLSAEIASELALELGAEEVVKYIPIAGTILACVLSATLTSRYLIRCINELEEVALLIMDTETA